MSAERPPPAPPRRGASLLGLDVHPGVPVVDEHDHGRSPLPPKRPPRQVPVAPLLPLSRPDGDCTGPQCELHPDQCYVYDSICLLIDLPKSAVWTLTTPTCIVTFYGDRSHRKLAVDGFRRNHDYGIRTCTPVWYEKESVTVTVTANGGQLLGVGTFSVLARTQTGRPLPSVVTCVEEDGDSRSVMFIKEVIGSFIPATQLMQTSTSMLSSSACLFSIFMWCGESQATATELLDKVITFAMDKGLPHGVSLWNMFSDLPDLKRVLEASIYARGSLHLLLSSVQSQSKDQHVTDQISWLVDTCNRRSEFPAESRGRPCDLTTRRQSLPRPASLPYHPGKRHPRLGEVGRNQTVDVSNLSYVQKGQWSKSVDFGSNVYSGSPLRQTAREPAKQKKTIPDYVFMTQPGGCSPADQSPGDEETNIYAPVGELDSPDDYVQPVLLMNVKTNGSTGDDSPTSQRVSNIKESLDEDDDPGYVAVGPSYVEVDPFQ